MGFAFVEGSSIGVDGRVEEELLLISSSALSLSGSELACLTSVDEDARGCLVLLSLDARECKILETPERRDEIIERCSGSLDGER